MPAIIENIIPSQGFELVRDKIGLILTEEVDNQESLQALSSNASVFNERNRPYSDEEGVMINVMYDGSDYGSISEKHASGSNTYYVDVYAPGKATTENEGGYNGSSLLHKYLGICRYILQSHLYNTLGFEPGLIMGTYVENIQISDPQNNQDASNVCMGRITLSVRIVEDQNLWDGIILDSSQTGVKLELTEKGYKYEI